MYFYRLTPDLPWTYAFCLTSNKDDSDTVWRIWELMFKHGVVTEETHCVVCPD